MAWMATMTAWLARASQQHWEAVSTMLRGGPLTVSPKCPPGGRARGGHRPHRPLLAVIGGSSPVGPPGANTPRTAGRFNRAAALTVVHCHTKRSTE